MFAEESSDTVKVASYILIGVGSLSMALGFFGCIGAIYEVRCLLGLVRNLYSLYKDTSVEVCILILSLLSLLHVYNISVIHLLGGSWRSP